MTGQDAVVDAGALEREAHMRAPIIESEDPPAIVDDEDRSMVTVHDEPPLRLELLEASRKRKFLVWRVHEPTSGSPSWGRVSAATQHQHRHPLPQMRKAALVPGLPTCILMEANVRAALIQKSTIDWPSTSL